MVASSPYPPDLKPDSILDHFHAISSTSTNTSEYETLALGIRAAKTSIKIAELLHEVTSWGTPTLTSWNTTEARRHEILTIHSTLSDLALPDLHSKVSWRVTGGTPLSPRWLIGPEINIIAHTVLTSLPLLARLRIALAWWEDCLERAEARKALDEGRRVRMEKQRENERPRVEREFRNVIAALGGVVRGCRSATPIPATSHLGSTSHNATPPATPSPRPPSSTSNSEAPPDSGHGVKETFQIGELGISWIPFPRQHPRFHTHAYIVVYRPQRPVKQLYVSLTCRGGRTTIYGRVGGGWVELERWLEGLLGKGRV